MVVFCLSQPRKKLSITKTVIISCLTLPGMICSRWRFKTTAHYDYLYLLLIRLYQAVEGASHYDILSVISLYGGTKTENSASRSKNDVTKTHLRVFVDGRIIHAKNNKRSKQMKLCSTSEKCCARNFHRTTKPEQHTRKQQRGNKTHKWDGRKSDCR